tara:strand:- start:264 stop:425 length:162 start_codon:yes stop_codon:yes gene_type:complete
MNIGNIASTLYKKLGPEVNVDYENKTVEIRGGLFFANATRAYYALKGYQVNRV